MKGLRLPSLSEAHPYKGTKKKFAIIIRLARISEKRPKNKKSDVPLSARA